MGCTEIETKLDAMITLLGNIEDLDEIIANKAIEHEWSDRIASTSDGVGIQYHTFDAVPSNYIMEVSHLSGYCTSAAFTYIEFQLYADGVWQRIHRVESPAVGFVNQIPLPIVIGEGDQLKIAFAGTSNGNKLWSLLIGMGREQP